MPTDQTGDEMRRDESLGYWLLLDVDALLIPSLLV